MDQKQSDELRLKWLAAEKKKKKLVTGLTVFLFSLSIIFVAWWGFSYFTKEDNQNILPFNKTVETTTIYGVEIQKKCFEEFQDFVEIYGTDYSKCLVDFDFNGEYCGGSNSGANGLSNINLIVILDSSGSMADKVLAPAGLLPAQEKIDVAKEAISDFLTKLPQGINTELIVYGHEGSNSMADKSLSCKGIEEVVKLGANNSASIVAAMGSFSPRGWTPLAGSLDFAKNVFKSKGIDSKNYLILVSDGVESCDGNPALAAENLRLEIPGTKLSVVGFTNDINTQEFLRKIAILGGGSYLTASTSSDIAKAFNDELIKMKKECISTTILQMYSKNNTNNINNLTCWLAAYKKESDDFIANVVQESVDDECNLEISNVLQARRNEFWYKKEAIVGKNDIIYKNIESDLKNKLKGLGGL